jgi:hypothetical protein
MHCFLCTAAYCHHDRCTASCVLLCTGAYCKVVRVEALASQAGPVEVAALSKPAQQSLEQQQAVQAARQGPQDLAARRAQATRCVASDNVRSGTHGLHVGLDLSQAQEGKPTYLWATNRPCTLRSVVY